MDTSNSSSQWEKGHTVNVCRCLSADHEQILSSVLRQWQHALLLPYRIFFLSTYCLSSSSQDSLMTGSRCSAIVFSLSVASVRLIQLPLTASSTWRSLWDTCPHARSVWNLIWHSAPSRATKLCLDHTLSAFSCQTQRVAHTGAAAVHSTAQHTTQTTNRSFVFCLCAFL